VTVSSVSERAARLLLVIITSTITLELLESVFVPENVSQIQILVNYLTRLTTVTPFVPEIHAKHLLGLIKMLGTLSRVITLGDLALFEVMVLHGVDAEIQIFLNTVQKVMEHVG
jgi:hypothetical protein